MRQNLSYMRGGLTIPREAVGGGCVYYVGGSKAITVQGAIMILFASCEAIAIESDTEVYELVFLSMCILLT